MVCFKNYERTNSLEVNVDKKEFSYFRKKMSKTQKQMAQLLGTSLKAVHSYEQGWRQIPTHVERQLFFLLSRIYARENRLYGN